MGPTLGWSDTEECNLISQFQLPLAKNIMAYVLSRCKNLAGVTVFGGKASGYILPWLRSNFFQKFLIQSEDTFLSHPQNIKWRCTLLHAQNYAKVIHAIMLLLGVDIPPLNGVVNLQFLMSKKCTLEMIECEDWFVDS